MARYEHLNVYKEVYNLSVTLFIKVSKFDRNYKFTIWNRLIDKSIEVLELIIFINSLETKDRKSYFLELEKWLERLTILINIANDLKLFWKLKTYLGMLEILVKVKKMVKCWDR